MDVKLLYYTPLAICVTGIRTCWNSHNKSDNGGTKDLDLIDRVGNKNKHKSVLEHIVYNFHVSKISRACLMQITRHRMASYSVKSTRYTLKELKSLNPTEIDYKDYVYLTGNPLVDNQTKVAFKNTIELVKQGLSNDEVKYSLPEAFFTEFSWTINARSLQNFLRLRTSKSAMKEIREFAFAVYDSLPIPHKYIYQGELNEKNESI